MEVTSRARARLVVVAVAVATWFLVGYLSEGGGTDHIFEVPQLDRPVEIAVGIGVAAVAVTAGWGFLGRNRSWVIDDGWWRVYGRLLLAGVLFAVGGRLVTAGSVGANIGGGIIMMLGPVLLLYLVGRAREESVRLRHAAAPGWMPSGFEWLWRDGGGIGLRVAVGMIAGFMAMVLIPWPALAALASCGALAWLVVRRWRGSAPRR